MIESIHSFNHPLIQSLKQTMAKKASKKELGKGIRALLGNIETEVNSSKKQKEETVKVLSSNFASIPTEQVEVNPHQPRKDFDETALAELVASIKTHGLIQPITVRRMREGEYQLISGERRLRASKIAGLKEIPAFIRIADDAQMMEMALIENTHRQDLNDIEVAITYQRLIDEFKLTHDNLSERLGKSRSSITNHIRLLHLPPRVQKALKERQISMGHARALLSLDDLSLQTIYLQNIIDQGLSVRATENLIKQTKSGSKSTSKSSSPSLPIEYIDVQDRISRHLGSKVNLKRDAKSGKGSITITFADDDDLNRLLDLIEE